MCVVLLVGLLCVPVAVAASCAARPPSRPSRRWPVDGDDRGVAAGDTGGLPGCLARWVCAECASVSSSPGHAPAGDLRCHTDLDASLLRVDGETGSSQ